MSDKKKKQNIEKEEINIEEQELPTETTDLQEKLLRLQADFVNMKQRQEKEKSEFAMYSLEKFVTGLLPVMDAISATIQHIPEDLVTNKWTEGVLHSSKMLFQFTESLGLTKMNITPMETDFDPTHHEAIATVEDKDHSGKILEIFQDGYILRDSRVIRTAKVKVGS